MAAVMHRPEVGAIYLTEVTAVKEIPAQILIWVLRTVAQQVSHLPFWSTSPPGSSLIKLCSPTAAPAPSHHGGLFTQGRLQLREQLPGAAGGVGTLHGVPLPWLPGPVRTRHGGHQGEPRLCMCHLLTPYHQIPTPCLASSKLLQASTL